MHGPERRAADSVVSAQQQDVARFGSPDLAQISGDQAIGFGGTSRRPRQHGPVDCVLRKPLRAWAEIRRNQP